MIATGCSNGATTLSDAYYERMEFALPYGLIHGTPTGET